MNKINNKIVVYSLGMLAILTLLTITMPTKVHARDDVYGGNGNSTWCDDCTMPRNGQNYNQAPIYIDPAPVYINPAPVYVNPTRVVYSNSASTSTASVEKITPKESDVINKTLDDSSNLASNAIFGSNSFMPSGIIQWILFAIFVLLIVILVRKISGADKKYHSTPMKHA